MPSNSRRWLEYALRDSASASGSSKHGMSISSKMAASSAINNDAARLKRTNEVGASANPLYVSETLQFWPSEKKFVQMACMHSELIAITNTGELCQWKWSDSEPYKCIISDGVTIYHPKTLSLCLMNEKISKLSASCIRATVLTESDKLATWMDKCLFPVAIKLEHAAQSFGELANKEKIISLHVCSLYSCVRVESGEVYWWGVPPFSLRKKMLDKLKLKNKKQKNSSSSNEIQAGSQVCLRHSPSFNIGALAFNTTGNVPKVGQLMNLMWNTSDICSFRVLTAAELKKLQAPLPSVTPMPCMSKIEMKVADQQPPSPSCSKSTSTSQERLEMPPPPSPASSTCSEPGASPLPKRSKRLGGSGGTGSGSGREEEKQVDEVWDLKNVVFLDDSKNVCIGRVIKIDGTYAAVRFAGKESNGNESSMDVNSLLQDCRLLKKDELRLIKPGNSVRQCDYIQRQPKRLTLSDSSNIIKMTVSNKGIHAIVRNGIKLNYVVYSLATGRPEQECAFPTDTQSFFGSNPSNIHLQCYGESSENMITLLRDGNGALYPFAKDCNMSIKDPVQLNLPPVQSIGFSIVPLKDGQTGAIKSQVALGLLFLQNQFLTPEILGSDPEMVRLALNSIQPDSVTQQSVIAEKMDGNRNLLHTAVYMCFPTSNKLPVEQQPPNLMDDTSNDGINDFLSSNNKNVSSLQELIKKSGNQSLKKNDRESASVINDSQQQAPQSQSSSSAQQQLQPSSVPHNDSSSNQDSNSGTNPIGTGWNESGGISDAPFLDPNEQKPNGLSVLWTLTESPIIRPYLKDLLCAKNSQGYTPFMMAVNGRAYTAALHLFDVAQRIANESTERKRVLMSMLFPRNCNADDSPLFLLCYNDTCSFTWTGSEHINQDIFECTTCGLVESLCCCTECARICHRGHDCKLKRTSPTAYCDCWEKCKCKALVAGSQTAREQLLKRLLADTDLVTAPNSKGEPILLFLVQTVGRQLAEQRQHRPNRSRSSNKTKQQADIFMVASADTETPDHNLEPPRFSRRALDKILQDWNAVRAMVLTGYHREEPADLPTLAANLVRGQALSFRQAEEQTFIGSQNGTALLDKFTHYLLLKVGVEMLDPLLVTIIKQCSDSNPVVAKEARLVARRFVRSVARICVVLCIELEPSNYQHLNALNQNLSAAMNLNAQSNMLKKNSNASTLKRCKRVFQALLPIAIEELCEMADALIAPVRLGVARPTASFNLINSLTEAIGGSEELFMIDPVLSSFVAAPQSNDDDDHDEDDDDEDDSMNGSAADPIKPPVIINVHPSSAASVNEDMDALDVHPDEIDASDVEQIDFAESVDNPIDESDSESDSNADDGSYQSNTDNASGQRSGTTGAVVGSDAGVASLSYFSEEDSVDSSTAEDEEESETAETELETEDINFQDERLERERRTAQFFGSNAQANSAPTYSEVLSASSAQAASGSNASNTATAGSASNSTRNNLAQQLQWALGHRDSSAAQAAPATQSGRLGGASLFPNSTLIHFDSNSVRRNAGANNAVTASTAAAGSLESVSMATTAVSLARSFSIVMRQLAALVPFLHSGDRSMVPGVNALAFTFTEQISIANYIENRLRPTWEWLMNVMDSTEGQLRFGCALGNISGTTSVGHGVAVAGHGLASTSGAAHFGSQRRPNNFANISLAQNVIPVVPSRYIRINNLDSGVNNASDVGTVRRQAGVGRYSSHALPESNSSARRDFLQYAVSLMRAHNNEHFDSLPTLDVGSLKHVAYVFDALIYYIKVNNENLVNSKLDQSGSAVIRLMPKLIGRASALSGSHQPMESESMEESPCDDTGSDPNKLSSADASGSTISVANVISSKGRKHPFFQRSNSTLFLGCPPADPFNTPLNEALPLADQPQLLQPNSRREDLFGIPRSTSNPEFDQQLLDSMPARISLSDRNQLGRTSEYSNDHGSIAHYFAGAFPSPQIRSPIIVNSPLGNKSSVIVHGSSIAKQNTAASSSASAAFSPISAQKLSGSEPTATVAPLKRTVYNLTIGNVVQNDILLGRWRLTLELFGRVFVDDVGAEPGSIISELETFSLKEIKFRREMEKFRNSQQRDLTLNKIERDRSVLIQQTFKELNTMYANNTRRFSVGAPLLTVSRVKVTFKDEPGEGSGVARSFFTSFADAILSNERLPALDVCQANGSNTPGSSSRLLQFNLIQRLRPKDPQRRAYQSHSSSSSNSRSSARESSALSGARVSDASGQLRYDAPAFIMPNDSNSNSSHLINNAMNLNEVMTPERQQLGMRLYPRVNQLRPGWANLITGMLLELPPANLLTLFASDAVLRNKVEEALEIIMSHTGEHRASAVAAASNNNSGSAAPTLGGGSSLINNQSATHMQLQQQPIQGSNSSQSPSANASSVNQTAATGQPTGNSTSATNQLLLSAAQNADSLDLDMFNLLHRSSPLTSAPIASAEIVEEDDSEDSNPLFYQPGKRGFYSPRQGKSSPERLNAFRNVGRVLGMCLLLNELCPINLNRHVIKHILRKPIAWHDLAFFDPVLYESLRQLVHETETSRDSHSYFAALDLRFSVDLCIEEGGGQVDLIPNGHNVVVNAQNVYDYVRKYALYRMLKSQEKALQVLFSFDYFNSKNFN